MLEISEIEFSEWLDKARPGCTVVRGEKLFLAEIAVDDATGKDGIEFAKAEIRRLLKKISNKT